MTPEPSGKPASPLRLQSLPRRALVIAPVRLVLAAIGLAAAVVAGSRPAGALLAFGGATIATLLLVIADPRARFFQIPDAPPEAPAEASEDGLGRLALSCRLSVHGGRRSTPGDHARGRADTGRGDGRDPGRPGARRRSSGRSSFARSSDGWPFGSTSSAARPAFSRAPTSTKAASRLHGRGRRCARRARVSGDRRAPRRCSRNPARGGGRACPRAVRRSGRGTAPPGADHRGDRSAGGELGSRPRRGERRARSGRAGRPWQHALPRHPARGRAVDQGGPGGARGARREPGNGAAPGGARRGDRSGARRARRADPTARRGRRLRSPQQRLSTT